MSKIIIHSIAFSPDGVSTAYLYNDIAVKLKEEGFDVVVYTTTPHYNVVESELKKQPLKNKFLGVLFTSDYKGIRVNHIYQKKYKSTFKRILGFLFWHIMSFFSILFERDVKLIISPSPPLTIGLLNVILGKLKRVKVIYNVQEIYPDLLISEGGLKSNVIIKLLKRMEKKVYNHSNAVTTIDNIFYKTIIARFKDKNKLSIIPNFVDTDIYKPLNQEDYKLDENIFPETDDIKLMYAGNIGLAQDWDTLIEIVKRLKDDKFSFFVIGNGAMKTYLENTKQKYNLNKLHILPYQKREDIPKLIAYSDIQFIFMTPKLDGHGFPSKIYTIMACGKPILVASREKTPIVHFLQDKNCSIISTKEHSTERAEELIANLKNCSKTVLEKLGHNGLVTIDKSYSKEIVTQQYVDLIRKLL